MIFNPEPSAEREKVGRAYRNAITIALALTFSIVLYIVIGLLILRRSQSPGSRDDLLVPFYAAAAMFAVGALGFRRIQMSGTRLDSVAVKRGVPGVLAHLVTTTIISGALAEVVALLGLLLTIIGRDMTHVVRLGVVALAVSIYNYPRRAAWQKAIDYFTATLPQHQ